MSALLEEAVRLSRIASELGETSVAMFAPDELIAALADGGVEYVLIGGLAVGAHGYPRATKDVDIVPSPEASNLARLAAVLRSIAAQHHGLGDFDSSEFPYDPLDPGQLAEGGNFVLMTRLGASTSCSGFPVFRASWRSNTSRAARWRRR